MTSSMAERLDGLYSFLTETYPYYRPLSGRREGFFSLPFLKKAAIGRNRELFAHPFLQPELETYTSGTTGIPFRCVRTRQEQLALSMALFRQRIPWGLPARHRLLLLSNRMTDEPHMLLHYEKLLQQQEPHLIQGRSAALYALAVHCLEAGFRPAKSLKLVQNWGEPIQPGHAAVIEEAFGVPYTDYYGLEEIWLIGYSDSSGRLRIDERSVYVEIIDPERQQPLLPGEYGEIAVTSFVMQSLPYIRYRTGDIGRLLRDEQSGASYLELLPVRTAHIRLPDRNVHASIFRYLDKFFHTLAMEQGVIQYQLVQEQYHVFRLLLLVNAALNTEELERKLGPMLSRYLSAPVEVRAEIVQHIPPNPANGKTLSFISLIS
ncbi:MAG: Coenzyme synthetase [Paenibacillaceae bacterium]|jgi:phenylacetate-coenzyme A ligase PaaK-like adenylate-forming protein|nr:Coenzyme synthetase [Paenibacillaceae bacterium]